MPRRARQSRFARRRRSAFRRRRASGLSPEPLEPRRLLAFDLVAAYADSVRPFFQKGVSPPIVELNQAPQQIALQFSPGARLNPATLTGNISVVRTGPGGGSVDVGLSVDDAPNESRALIRFKEAIPDGSYQIVVGAGLRTLATPADTAAPTTVNVRVDLGAFVASVVPQPVTRDGTGALVQARGAIDVYFTTDDPLQKASAENTSFYRLFQINSATNAVIGTALSPTSVEYDAATGRARLAFGVNLENAAGLYRLEIGGTAAAAPVVVAAGNDNNSSFTTALDLGGLTAAGATISAAIENRPRLPTPVGALDFPSPPGALDTPGHRDVPVDSGTHGTPPFAVVDPATGIRSVAYNFRPIIGTDPQGNLLPNVITDAQKQRAREIFELYSLGSGVRFVETPDQGLMVATGDLRAFNPNLAGTTVAGLGGGSGALMNSSIDWGVSDYGGGWFRVAMHEIGHALGLQHTYDLPSIMGADLGGEAIFPGDYDFEHLRQLYPSNGSDIDAYRFTLAETGRFSAETVVARPGQPVTSYLDAVISLYRQDAVTGRRELVARNDDYYGRDAFVGLDLAAGTYFVAVTSTGNTAFDPAISDSGANGRTAGGYRLDLKFTPASAAANTVVDLTGKPIDGDRDGVAGGAFKFWFNTAAEADTIYVDKASPQPGAGVGSRLNPYKKLDDALANVQPTTRIIRIAGTATTPYQIGTDAFGRSLSDGATFDVPKGVTAMIDGGAIFKLRAANIDVGSASQLVSRAGAAIQVLGVPKTGSYAGNRVTFTSWHDDSIGGNSDNVGPVAQGGQWGGIVLRQDSDAASRQAFVNSIAGADIRYGGGEIASQQKTFAPIQIESTRPTVIFNTITDSAGAAMAATPNSFEDTGDRVGPEFRGNRLIEVRNDGINNAPVTHQNSVNGLFIKIETKSGAPTDRLDVPARFKSTDIVYVIQENLVINGGVGGYTSTIGRLGTLAAGSKQVTGLAKTSDLRVGMQVEIRDPANPGTSALPLGQTTIASIDGPTSITLSAAPLISAASATVSFRLPPARVEQTGDVTISSPMLTNVPSTAGITPGMRVEIRDPANPLLGLLPGGTATVVAVGPNAVLLSAAANVTRTGMSISFIDQTVPVGFARDSGRLTIDPGVVVKLQGSRIELDRGIAQLVAEGLPGKRVIFTSLGDNRYGAGGTLDTNGNVPDKFDAVGRPVGTLTTGDWGGIMLNAGSKASIDEAYVAFGGGATTIEGGFDNFNVIEVHQGDLRLANTRVEQNAAGTATSNRTGRGGNAAATVFVRGSQPIIVDNDFRANAGALISINANALSDVQRGDTGRTTGVIDRVTKYDDNFGPLVRGNRLTYQPGVQATAGMVVRGGEITVESVWDDTDIVHVLQDEIIVQNFHTATGVRLLSKPDASLVVKLEGVDAGFTAAGENLDIDDRIGGTVQIVGQPGYPVVLTSLRDDTVGASLDPRGALVTDTNVDGAVTAAAAGDWRSLRFLPFSNDRNVAILTEREKAYTGKVDANGLTGVAESLGVLALNYASSNNTWESAQEKNGDENRRLGFEVHGTVAYDDPSDVDVYKFLGYAGSEVWIDVDKTTPALDAMVELLDASGNVLARSVDGFAEGGVEQGEVVNDLVGGTTVTYQFSPGATPPGATPALPGLPPGQFSILPGTLSGVIYDTAPGVPTAIQTFSVDAKGVVIFQNILGNDRLGAPNTVPVALIGGGSDSAATGGTVNLANGTLTLTFSGTGIVSSRVEVRYSYQTSVLSTVTGIGQTLGKDAWRGGDYFTQNPRDPGMRVILPGTPSKDPTPYFVRVRSQPRYEPATTAASNGGVTATTANDYRDDVSRAAKVKAGATSGRYELRVRLRQRDEKPGSTVRYADIRYPTIGIDVQGLPANSPLVADTAENPTDNNNTFATAQYIGNVLESNRGALSVAGTTSGEGDVDWYTFALNYEQIQSIGGVNDGPYNWATIFDIDYADGFRGDLTISVFDSTGRLIYVGRDSDVTDDQPGPLQGNDFDDLSKGSAGKLDAFIGTVDLEAGGPTGGGGGDTGLPPTPPNPAAQRRYYVAVSSNERLPTQLNATFGNAAANTAVRLEPIASIDRIITDRIGAPEVRYPGVAADERLIDTAALAAHITPFTLADVTLFVTTGNSLVTVDAMRDVAVAGGGVETTIQANYGTATTIGDLLMRSDGNLYVYRGVNRNVTTAGQLALVDSGSGAATVVGNDNIKNPIPLTETNLAPTQTGTVATTTFNLTGDFLRQPQVSPITGTVRYQRVDTSVTPNVTRSGTWNFTAAAAAINGSAALTFTPVGTPDPLLGSAPTNGVSTVNLKTGVVSINWGPNSVATTGVRLDVSYQYTFQDVATDAVDAVAWRRSGIGTYDNLMYSVWDPGSGTSFLYQGDNTTGSAAFVDGQNFGLQGTLSGAVIGRVKGMAWLGGTLYGVDDNGNLFTVTGVDDGDFTITTNLIDADPTTPLVIDPIVDGLGNPIAFEGLTVGPQNLAGGGFSTLLFGIDGGGNLYCFDTTGALQPVFDFDGDGLPEATSIGTGVTGARGLAFSPLDINLWHTTTRRSGDAGGGTSPTEQLSMYFGLEALGGAQFGGNAAWQQDLLANPAIRNNYNLPGGAYGSLTTNAFSLTGYTYTDKPTLYFDYWLATEGASGTPGNVAMRDSARVLASIDGGLTWELLATNNSLLSTADTSNRELPNFPSVSSRISNDAVIENQHVQELFDTSNWRQARVDLGKFAGQANIRLRFDFSTAGKMDETQQSADIDGDGVNDLINNFVNDTTGRYTQTPGLANTTGAFRDTDTPNLTTARQRGQNNAFEGFYIDDIVIGFAERGEAVTGATAGATTFFDVGTPGPSTTVGAQKLDGPYQLEIRRGTERSSVAVPDALAPAPFPETFDTNERLIGQRSNTTAFGPMLGDANQPREQGQFIVENNIVIGAAEYGIRIDAAARDGGSNAPHPGAPRNLPTLNNARLAAGAVVINNVVARSGTAGILVSGDPNTGNVPLAAVPFARLVNNTIYGGEAATGIGVQVTDNAAPTLLNNLFANLAQGVTADASSAGRTVVGQSAYWNTTTQLSGVATQSFQVVLTEGSPFVNALRNNFYLVPGTRAIDSSLNSLPDRNEFKVVNSPIGIDESPILAPDRDLYGQLRSDDPGVTNMTGFGQNVFKDRGAIDRVDFAQPYALLAVPLDNAGAGSGGPVDVNPANDRVRLEKGDARGITRFELQLGDGVGVGIDTTTVVSGAFQVRLNGALLVAETDYLFNFLQSSNRVVFEAAAVFTLGTYEISVVQTTGANPVNVVADLAGNPLLPNQTDGTTKFTIELADVPTAPTTLVGVTGDGQVTLTWGAATSTGTPLLRYELERATDSAFTTGVVSVNVAADALTRVVAPLANGTSYWFRVRGVNAVGESTWSNVAGPIVPLPIPAFALAVDTGVSTTDGISSNGLVNVTNVLPGATWEYSLDGGVIWSAPQAAATTTFMLPANATYAAGNVRVRQTVGTSQSAAGTNATALTIDTNAPVAAPVTAVNDDVARFIGIVPDGGVTNDATLALSGTTEAGTVVEVFNGANKLGDATVTGTTWAFTTAPLADGTSYAFKTRVRDLAGNVGPDSATRSATIDITPPAAPVIVSVFDDVAPATGSIPSGGVTNDPVLVLSGTTDNGTAVEILDGANKLGDATVTGTTWTFTTAPLSNGVTYAFKARSIDGAGNVGPGSATHSVTIDTEAPPAPVIVSVTDDILPATGQVAPGGFTNDTVLVLAGTTAAGTSVEVFNGADKLGIATVVGTSWTFTTGALVEGATYVFTARAIDAASNASAASAPHAVTIDTLSPTIAGFGTDAAAGAYGIGAVIRITATMNETVRAGSALVVTLNTGAVVTLVASTQGSVLAGIYTVSAGQNAAPLAVVAVNAAGVTDLADNVAVGTLPAANLPAGIIVDGIAPSVLRYESTTPDGTYGIGAAINITAVVSEPVRAGSTMTVTLSTGTQVTLVAAAAGATLTGTYVVQAGQAAADLDVVAANPAAVRDIAGNAVTNAAGGLLSLAANRSIVVLGAVGILTPNGFSTNPALVPDRRVAVTSIPITFNTPVTGFTLANLSLRIGNRTVSLRGARLTGSGANYVLTMPAKLTSLRGIYTLRITGTGIVAASNGFPMTDTVSIYWGKGRKVG